MVAVDPPSGPSSPTKATSSSPLLGTLVVIVLRARHLTNRVRIGKQNPYCTVTYGLNKKRTETIERGGQQPVWDAEFRFELLKDERDQLGGDAGKALVDKRGAVMPLASASEQAKQQAAATPAPASNGKKVLRLACYADDAKDPKLVGEGTLELDEIIKKGTFDDWVPIERKGKFAGEVFLELTWYSSEPPRERAPQRQQESPSGAYGGPGSRTEDFSDDDRSTEEWDGSDVGPSPAARLDVAADYPDPDLAPLSQSMSALAVSQGRPLPAPPGSAPHYQQHHQQGYGPPPPQQHPHYQQQQQYPESNRRASYAGGAGGTYGSPPHGYQAGPSEFGGYVGGHQSGTDQTTINASTHGRVSGFQQLADQHYAQQSYGTYEQPPTSYHQIQYALAPSTGYEPPPSLAYSQPPQQYSQAPAPPQPPATPSHWSQQQQSHPLPQPPSQRPHSSTGHYGSVTGQSLPHSSSVSSFAPPPPFVPPPSLQHQQPAHEYAYSQAPSSQFAPPPTFSAPPPPPSFGQFSPHQPPQPPQPPPSRYGNAAPNPPPSNFYAQPPQPPMPPPSLQQYQYEHASELQDYQYNQQPPQSSYYAPPPPPPQQQPNGYAPAGGHGHQLPPPPGHDHQQQQGTESYNPYHAPQQQYR